MSSNFAKFVKTHLTFASQVDVFLI